MMKILILFLFTIIFPLTSLGLDTSSTNNTIVKNYELPEASCSLVKKAESPATDKSLSAKEFIKNSGESRIDNSFCSATVIDTNKILTSAHCLTEDTIKEKKNIQLVCTGGVVRDLNLESIHRKKEFDYINTDKLSTSNMESASDDLATVETTEDIGIAPAKIVESYTEFWDLLDNHKCIAQGYGKDENGLTGLVNAVHMNSEGAWLITKDQTKLMANIFEDPDFNKLFKFDLNSLFSEDNRKDQGDFITFKKKDAVIRPGDSGGGFFCKNANNKWVLVGVNELAGNLKNIEASFMINLAEHQDWLNKTLGKISPFEKYHNTEKEQVEHFCRIYENCNSLLNENLAKLTVDVTNSLAKLDQEVVLEQSYQDLVTDLRIMIEKCIKKLNLVLEQAPKNKITRRMINDYLSKSRRYQYYEDDFDMYNIDPVKEILKRLQNVPERWICDTIEDEVSNLRYKVRKYKGYYGRFDPQVERLELILGLVQEFHDYYHMYLNNRYSYP